MSVVLVPGFMLDEDLWADMIGPLSALGPIHHADPRRGLSIEDLAAQTLEHAPEQFSLIGFSMGGFVAREMQRRAPNRVSRLALIATAARADTEAQAQRKAQATAAAPCLFRGLSCASIRHSLAPDRDKDTVLIDRIRAASLRLGGEVFRRQAMFCRAGDLDRLALIGCPTLIVAGRHDRLRSLDEAEEMQRAIPNSTLQIIEAGHMIPMEAPTQLSAILMGFLTS